jgi:hypothetical protein
MHTALSSLRRVSGLLGLGAALILPLSCAEAADTPKQADAFPNYESYIKISGQAPWITGDTSAFANRTGTPSAGSGGIEDLFYTRDLSDNTTMTINGRALAGVDDYLASFKLDTSKVGTVDIGYSRFRTFYDGVGGFFPLSDRFMRWNPEELHVDRSKFWVDLKLALPDRPVFTLSFHNEVRTGMKDSTEWGPIINPNAVVVKGALVGTAVPVNTPFIAPNVQMLDEHHNILTAGMVATIGKTEETLKLTFDEVNNTDARSYVKFPGSNVIANPTVTVRDDQASRKANSFRFLNQTETKLSDQFTLGTGFTYTHLSSTNSGNWITPTYSATANAVYTADTAAYIYGGAKFDDYVGTVSLDYTPNKDWLIKMEYRDEYDVTGSSGGFTNTTLATGSKTVAPVNITTRNELTYSHFRERIETPELSIEYTGFKDLTLYANFDDRINQADQHWINPYIAVSTTGAGVATLSGAPIGSVFFQDADQNNESMKIGANWNPSSLMTVRAELFRKVDFNQFVGANSYIGTASYGALYATGYTFTGVKFSIILKPTPGLTFSTRYQPQVGMMSVAANTGTGGTSADNEITSGKVTGQMISETVNWALSQSIYLQANINVVYNQIQTAYPLVVVSATTYVPMPIQNSNNNYITGSALCGFVLDKNTDAQLQVSWSRANNYNPQIAAGGEPYGAGFLDECGTAGVKHKFSPRLFGEFKAGYIRRTNDTTGGFTNYRGPLAYASLTYSL